MCLKGKICPLKNLLTPGVYSHVPDVLHQIVLVEVTKTDLIAYSDGTTDKMDPLHH